MRTILRCLLFVLPALPLAASCTEVHTATFTAEEDDATIDALVGRWVSVEDARDGSGAADAAALPKLTLLLCEDRTGPTFCAQDLCARGGMQCHETAARTAETFSWDEGVQGCDCYGCECHTYRAGYPVRGEVHTDETIATLRGVTDVTTKIRPRVSLFADAESPDLLEGRVDDGVMVLAPTIRSELVLRDAAPPPNRSEHVLADPQASDAASGDAGNEDAGANGDAGVDAGTSAAASADASVADGGRAEATWRQATRGSHRLVKVAGREACSR